MYISTAAREYVQAVQKLEKRSNTSVISEEERKSAREKDWEFRRFKIEFYRDVEKIPKSDNLDMLVVNVSDSGWERMMEEPEYRQEILDRIRLDTTNAYGREPVDKIISVGGSSEEYRVDSFCMPGGRIERLMDERSYVERRKQRKKRQKAIEEYMWQKHMQEKSMIENMAKKRAGLPEGEVFVADSMLDILKKYNNNFLFM